MPSKENYQYDRVNQLRIESRVFIDQCKRHIQNSKELCGHASWLVEELMILKEESIVNKCESLAILKLSYELGEKPLPPKPVFVERSIADDTLIARHMIDEVKQALIPDDNPTLQALRSQFLGLTFLPE